MLFHPDYVVVFIRHHDVSPAPPVSYELAATFATQIEAELFIKELCKQMPSTPIEELAFGLNEGWRDRVVYEPCEDLILKVPYQARKIAAMAAIGTAMVMVGWVMKNVMTPGYYEPFATRYRLNTAAMQLQGLRPGTLVADAIIASDDAFGAPPPPPNC